MEHFDDAGAVRGLPPASSDAQTYDPSACGCGSKNIDLAFSYHLQAPVHGQAECANCGANYQVFGDSRPDVIDALFYGLQKNARRIEQREAMARLKKCVADATERGSRVHDGSDWVDRPLATVCDCGAKKAGTTHAKWCSAYEGF